MTENLETATERLLDALNRDVNGIPGMPLSGNGGLVSVATMKAADQARLALHRHKSAEQRGA